MRVTFIGQNSPDKFSGGRYHAWMMAEAAAYMGHDVLFVTDNKPFFYDDFSSFSHHQDVKICLRPVLKDHGWDLPKHKCNIIVAIPHGKLTTPHYYLKARLFAMQRQARLIMINFESANWFNAMSPTKRDPAEWDGWKLCSEGASIVLSIAAEGTKYAKEFYDTCPKYTLFRHCYPCINSIVADSVKGVGKERRIILLTRFHKSNHKGGFNIPDLLCEAMRDYTLVFVIGIGGFPAKLMEEIDRRAAKYGIKIEILRMITDKEKFREIKRSSLMLFPSYFEGFGLPPVEAQYCNVPCIAFDLPVLREVSGDGLIYVERGNVEMFRKKIEEVLNSGNSNDHLREHISEVACFENYAIRVDDILHFVMENSKPSTSWFLSIFKRAVLKAELISFLLKSVKNSPRMRKGKIAERTQLLKRFVGRQ
jgi:glycosyltransferase involved in cell wall biosynthesis